MRNTPVVMTGQWDDKYEKKKDPVGAVLLSFLVPGLGQMYNGQMMKGVIYFVIASICWTLTLVLIGFLLAPIWWGISVLDAYVTANKINNGERFNHFINFA